MWKEYTPVNGGTGNKSLTVLGITDLIISTTEVQFVPRYSTATATGRKNPVKTEVCVIEIAGYTIRSIFQSM